MKTTFDLSDDLAIRARKLAADRRVSLKALVEEGLGLVLMGASTRSVDPLRRLKGRHKHLWEGVDTDTFVREQREGWGA